MMLFEDYKPVDFNGVELDYPAMARSMMLNIPKEFQDENLPIPNRLVEAINQLLYIIDIQTKAIDKASEVFKQIAEKTTIL